MLDASWLIMTFENCRIFFLIPQLEKNHNSRLGVEKKIYTKIYQTVLVLITVLKFDLEFSPGVPTERIVLCIMQFLSQYVEDS